MPLPTAVQDLITWVESRSAEQTNPSPAYLAAIGVLSKHEHRQLPADVFWNPQVVTACTSVAARLRETAGADLGHTACLAQGLLLLRRVTGTFVPDDAYDHLMQALAEANYDATSTVIIERWMESYGFGADDSDLVSAVAVPMPAGLAFLATPAVRHATPVLAFPLRPVLGGEGEQGVITESVFAHAAATDGDAPESLRRQVVVEPQAHDAVPGLTVGRELLPDWTLVIDLRMNPAPAAVHLQGLPLIYDSLFDGWIANLRALPRSERLRLLNGPLTVRSATGERIHITCHPSGQ